MRTVDDVLRVAKSAGVIVLVEGYDLILEHEADPPPTWWQCSATTSGSSSARSACARPNSEASSRSGSTTTSLHRHPASAPIAATGRDQRTLSFCCSSETIAARCTASCHPTWLARREAEARMALGIGS